MCQAKKGFRSDGEEKERMGRDVSCKRRIVRVGERVQLDRLDDAVSEEDGSRAR